MRPQGSRAGSASGVGALFRFCARPKRSLAAILAAAALLARAHLACAPRPSDATLNPMGPNAACYVCHIAFLREPLSTTHVKATVSCVRCHGVSAGHANDEDIGATKPDIVYTRAQVNAACRKCHPTHDVAPEKVLGRWQQRRSAGRVPKAATPAAAVCTDCHGRHRIARPQKAAAVDSAAGPR